MANVHQQSLVAGSLVNEHSNLGLAEIALWNIVQHFVPGAINFLHQDFIGKMFNGKLFNCNWEQIKHLLHENQVFKTTQDVQ